MDNDVPFFIDNINNPDYIWKITLLGGVFTGTLIWHTLDAGDHPIMISLAPVNGNKIVEIPWTAIQCITYEGKTHGK